MDEIVDLDKIGPWDIEDITDDCILFRQVHSSQKVVGSKPRRFPNEAHFDLRPDEDYLSFNWDRYIDVEKNFHLIGITKSIKGNFLEIQQFTIFKYPVGYLRGIEKVAQVSHVPVFDEENIPAMEGKPNNKAHAGLYLSDDNLSFRVAMSDYCGKNYDKSYCSVDKTTLSGDIEALRERGNDTPFHKDWVFPE